MNQFEENRKEQGVAFWPKAFYNGGRRKKGEYYDRENTD